MKMIKTYQCKQHCFNAVCVDSTSVAIGDFEPGLYTRTTGRRELLTTAFEVCTGIDMQSITNIIGCYRSMD